MSEKSKLIQLMDHCGTNVDNRFVLKIKDGEPILFGSAPKPVTPTSAIILQIQEKSFFVKGTIDNIYSELSSGNSLMPDTVFVGVDCRKNDNIKVYYNLGVDEQKITSKTDMSRDDMFLVYWETEYLGCLTFCSYDGVRDEVIREVLTANDEPMKRLLRGITSQFLSRLMPETGVAVHGDPYEMELSENE